MPIDFENNISLKQFTTYQIGGSADFFIEVKSIKDLIDSIKKSKELNISYRIIGGGSNILIDDKGFRGLVIKNSILGMNKVSENEFEFMSGESLDSAVEFTCKQNFYGMECLSGIPGSIGGAIVQNTGAYGQEICETVVSVKVLNLFDLKVIELKNSQCNFGYRNSHFKNNDQYFVISSRHALSNAKQDYKFTGMEQFNQKKNINPTEVRTWVIEQRKSKSTYWAPSDKNSMTCGSFFTNPIVERNILIAIQEKGYQPVFWEIDDLHVKISGGWLIENAGFTKGYQFRSVRISEKSALSIANWDGGSATDIKDLADQIEQKVFEKFSVKLKREVIYL